MPVTNAGLPRGFRLVRSGVLESWGIPWKLMRDEVSGAAVIHASTDPPEHFLGVSLLTPPRNSAGIPHILEHCVLNGSVSYPVRDAFNELWRGSLHTHLNAVTYPDRTVYFAGSTHRGEFLNLSRVYLDLVFNPLLDRRRMLLESFHLRPERRGRTLLGRPSGVIYSEMRGSYSDPGELASLRIQSELLPDTPYRNDSGGDPSAMGGTTWQEVRDYHREFYKPSNARIFVCSPMESEELALFLREVLPVMEAGDSGEAPLIPLQPRWRRPRRTRLVTPREPGGSSVSFSWLLGESGIAEQAALAQLMEEVLLSDAGSLYRVLMDSGLGTDLSTGTGLEVDLREMIFTAGLRETAGHKADAIRRVVASELSRFSDGGPDRDLLGAAVNSLLFAYLDKVEDFPLSLFTRAMRAWAYGHPPEGWMDHAAVLKKLASGPDLQGMLGSAARCWFLDNPHRLQLLVEPVGRRGRRERMVRLDSARHELISSEARELEEFSAEADSPEALRTIPRLAPAELPLEESLEGPEILPLGGTDLLLLNGASGTAWIEMAFDISDLSAEDDLILPLALYCLTGMGAGGLDHRALSIRMGLDTGGVDPRPAACELALSGRPVPIVSLVIGFFPDRPGRALDLLRRILLETDFGDSTRLSELVEELRGDGLSTLVQSSDWYARLHAAAALSSSASRRNHWEGLPQMRFISRIRDRNIRRLSGRLGELTARIFTRGRLVAASCLPGTDPGPATDALARFSDALPGGFRPAGDPGGRVDGGTRNMLMRLQSSVSTVCTAVEAPRLGSRDAALFAVGTAAFGDGLIYRRLRVSGGAYEVAAWHDPMAGLAYLSSSRDPDPARTRSFFAGSPDLLRGSPPSEDDVRFAVLSTFAGLEVPPGPRMRCGLALARHLAGVSRSDMERLRRDLAAVRADEVASRYPDLLEEALEKASISVFAPEGASVDELFGTGADVTVLEAGRYQ